ncbi:ferrous iron transport protein B [Deltaproteobacteria bacterium OttesenSCG-928-K17]|nr:ferrous iron transport protein B [Deltaproteobacteria bacterium OttesenSCG-928-K17]
MSKQILAALAGQPNCGKSTIFNAITGARQHVANYPGVTVEKKTGRFRVDAQTVELVDLPGTYSLTSYSLEEKVSRDFIIRSAPDLIVNVVDASNLKRNLYLTLQLLEMERPVAMSLNMMDVAKRRGMRIDTLGLAKELGVAVIPTMGKRGDGIADLKALMAAGVQEHQCKSCGSCGCGASRSKKYRIDYGPLEPHIDALSAALSSRENLREFPLRWLAIKLLEGDSEALALIEKDSGAESDEIRNTVDRLRDAFAKETGLASERHVAFTRHRTANKLAEDYLTITELGKKSLSDKIDQVVCHKVSGPLILMGILFLLYQVSIVYGGDLAAWIWPWWAKGQNILTGLLPDAGFLDDPLLYSLGVWVLKSVAAILNYLPIFLLLFALIAILEDSGYMPRMAFLLGRLFRRFGLHGQSTLPLILGGVYVGGCAIPAVMDTRAIPDEKARMATILVAPMMNCLAKVPLYLIMIGAYFSVTAFQSAMAMFFIATVTLFMALPVAKILTLTVLKGKASAPFIMEMPPYHLPTARTIVTRTVERIWLFIKKIITVILMVAIVIFALINFPGLNSERKGIYQGQADKAVAQFLKASAATSFAETISRDDVQPIILFEERLKTAKQGVTDQEKAKLIDARFEKENPVYYSAVRGKEKDSRELQKALKKLTGTRKKLRREMREEAFQGSFLGLAGRALEPMTRFAGFDWKINIALLSAFAAKENSAATLGAIYGLDDDGATVEESLKQGGGDFGPLHALALMIFMALYPPCVPTSVMVRMQSNSTGWMLFAIAYQALLGLIFATIIFTGGSLLNLSGWQAMWIFYGLCVAATIITGLIPDSKKVRKPASDLKPLKAKTGQV